MTTAEQQAEALERARNGQTWTNYPAIFVGFIEKGIPEHDIRPRENVFTFNAWKALGRSVKKGEHGVKVVTFIDRTVTERDPSSDEEIETSYRQPHTTTVFHISQTETEAERQARLATSRPLGSGPLDWPRERRLRHARKIAKWARPANDVAYPDPGELAADRWNETHY
jgi:hypothetical protein